MQIKVISLFNYLISVGQSQGRDMIPLVYTMTCEHKEAINASALKDFL